ncbi:MAG TPA: cytochrome c biogenesis protein ResB [Anaerohalosphaeraceae bacterium]|mgnify:FL=1|nr:cytochrome c biogenesis protein ResB [Anaerohalosphaeraceae bacterium]HOM76674.1 cytochrome c biogenesis protein ResB [Anaerohalosphaeraceae bacterium]HPC65074.1 cytochrome c biogenesis protein ResB [Anaerohalosphaeraceae bacterium]HPO70442.1 cytochrome c biogenesis protein ResB [Anaerohalosphaeraceae bacterium]HRS72103.1 cytochrome c biogenesis protein ResB [Anaerohalosphaeraceae bacterium]
MRIKQLMNGLVLILLGILAVCAVYGAFLGAQQAQAFFSSPVMIGFWCLLMAVLAAGFAVYSVLRRKSALMLIHGGCLAVLAGGMIGSQKAHQWAAARLGGPDWTKGQMQLQPGQSASHVKLETKDQPGHLPFEVRLKDASIDYYDKPAIGLYFNDGAGWVIKAEKGEPITIPDGRGTIEVSAVYRNFKLRSENGQMVPYESDEPGTNPAYQLVYRPAAGQQETFYVFERFGMHTLSDRTCRAEYIAPRAVKDYKSTLQIIQNGRVVKEAAIEVNKPLYYGGYHFYQHTFGYNQSEPVSGIMVVSARGIGFVFGGYGMILAGLAMHVWPKLFAQRRKSDSRRGNDGN